MIPNNLFHPGGWQRWCPARPAARGWHPPTPALPAPDVATAYRRRAAASRVMSLLVTLLFAAGALPPAARATEAPESPPGSGSLLLRMQSGYETATRLNTDVDIRVSGMVARVVVSQAFRNDSAGWTEGVYVFPLPDDAAVDRLRLTAGERIIEGEIREKAEAKKAYATARREGRRASLVGQQRANLFTTSVANIGPGETVTVEIGYLQTVAYDEGTFSLRFPLTLTPRYIPGSPLPDRQGSGWSADTDRVRDASLITPPMVASSTDHRVSLTANVDAGVPLAVIASRYHPVDIDEDGGRYTLRFSDAATVSDHDVELSWRPVPTAAPRALVFSEDAGGARHLLLMLLPPAADGTAVGGAPPRELVFVIDTSGSMQGTSIRQAKAALALALDGLRPADRFNLIRFSSVTQALYPASVPATAGNLSRAQAWLEALRANGGTEMRPALELALRVPAAHAENSPLRQVVFVTDGAVGNEAELFSVIEARLGATRLFTVGIGSAPNGWFMRRAAEAGRGSFTFISALHEVTEKMSLLLERLREPQLTDIELLWPDDAGVSAYPGRIRDLYPGEPVLVRARLDTAPRDGDQLVVRGHAPGGPWESQLALARGTDSPGVAALWARARIAALGDAGRRGADAAGTRAQIVDTALSYGLVSRHTSLVAVDRTPVRPATESLAREQVPNLLPYGQSSRAIFGFPATATAAPLLRIGGSLFLLVATLLLLYRVCTIRGPTHAAAGDRN